MRLFTEEIEQPLFVLLFGKNAVETAGVGDLKNPFGIFENGVGKEAAVGEDIHRAAQGRGGTDDAFESGRGVVQQAFE